MILLFQSRRKNNRWMEYSPSPFYAHWKHPPSKQVNTHLWEENPSNFKHSQQLQIHYNPLLSSLLLISSKYNMPNYISQTLDGQVNITHFPYTHVQYIQAPFPLSDVQSAIVTPGLQTLDHFCHCALINISYPSSRVSSKTRHGIPVILLTPRTFLLLCNIYIAAQPKTTLQLQHCNENSCWDDSLHIFLSLLSINYQFEDSPLLCWCNHNPGFFVCGCMKNAFWWRLII